MKFESNNTKNTSVKHQVQKKIIDYLHDHEIARFRDLRPAGTDTNLFSYHLNVLLKAGIVRKVDTGYTLGAPGLAYVDRAKSERNIEGVRPKIIVMFLVQNSDGDVLLQRYARQPYINTWSLPFKEVDSTLPLMECAQQAALDDLGLKNQSMTHAGDCYVRVKAEGLVISTTFAHIFRFNTDFIVERDDLMWARPHKLDQYSMAPAVEAVMTRGFFNDPFFFEEFEVEWV